ncbi:hypothetical protein M0R45_030317 [Rubus argutus]|uniref:Uncharacterized protein n=1 Tax=Rubus argutus TaxID=59490 RepID=A0AAW1WD97_RUBAR
MMKNVLDHHDLDNVGSTSKIGRLKAAVINPKERENFGLPEQRVKKWNELALINERLEDHHHHMSKNSKMGMTTSGQLSMGSAHVPNNGTAATSSDQIQQCENGTDSQESSSNSRSKPWILKYKIPEPIPEYRTILMK